MAERRIVLASESAKTTARQMLDRLPLGKPLCEVVFRRHKRRRKLDQNARYWALLNAVSEQLPDENGKYYSPSTWHEYMKAKFLPPNVFLFDGQMQEIPASTSDLEVMPFADYMTKVEMFVTERGVSF